MNSALKLLKYLKPYRLFILLAPLVMAMEVTMDLMQPRLIERIVDEGVANLNLSIVIHTGLLMFGLAVIGATGGMSNGIFAEFTVQGFGADLREALFRKVQSLSFGNLDELGTGQLITRLTNDVTQVQEAILMILRMLVRTPLLLVGSLVMAIVTSPQLAFIPLALMPIELVAVTWIVKRATPLYTRVQEKLDTLNSVMQENLAGMRVVKAFVRAFHEKTRFKGANDDLTGQSIQAARTVAVMPSFMMLTMNLGIAAVLWFGGVQVTKGGMQVGQIIAFVNYLMTTLFSLLMVSQMVIQLARAEASARRIQEVMDSQPQVQNRAEVKSLAPAQSDLAAKEIPAIPGRVAFQDVVFCYDGNDGDRCDPVLKGVDFATGSCQTVALLGTTGAGKSSLVNLIPRFYDVTAGRVMLDGVDVRDLDQEALRRRIGIALQETVLFSGTIRDNIRYGRPDASEEEVIAAARAAQAHEFITTQPEGYDTLVGQRGVNLSGGQKQRIAIARAILLKPDILILDDSTSAVDVETEAKIQDALDSEMAGCTRFIIAQRISSVLTADKILVLDDGQIAAQGTHRELMASSPIYREIYASQLGNGANGHE